MRNERIPPRTRLHLMTSTTTTIAVLPPCVAADCDKPCVFPPPPPAAAAAAADVNRNHLGPFLIAAVCILGISFLFLTSCTIILRCHFKRRRRPDSPTNESSSSSSSSFSSSVDHPIWNIVTVGLPQSVIDSITTFKYTNHDWTHCTCSVCLADFQVGDCLRLLPNCTHAFHLPCIDTWLRSHQNCPLCRAPILLNHFPTSTSTNTLTHTLTPHLHLAPQDDDDDDDDDANTINHLERLRVPPFSRVNRNSRVLSDLGVYYRFTTLHQHQHQHQHQHRDILIPHPITRSFSLNLLPASTIQAAASSTTHAYANADGVVDERPKTVENAPKRGTSTSGLGFLMIKSSSIGHSFQKGPVPIKRSLSLGAKLFSFPRTKSHNSILPL